MWEMCIRDSLTEEEHAVYRRGRNTRSVSAAKNQSITDYRRATGFEACLLYTSRVLGKMAHSERRGNSVAINIYGEQDLKIFESGVKYFK